MQDIGQKELQKLREALERKIAMKASQKSLFDEVETWLKLKKKYWELTMMIVKVHTRCKLVWRHFNILKHP